MLMRMIQAAAKLEAKKRVEAEKAAARAADGECFRVEYVTQ